METTTDTKFEMVIKGLLNLQQQVESIKAKNDTDKTPGNSPSGCAEGFPPSPSKTASKAGTHLDSSLLMDQVDDESDFLNWKELPQDVCNQMKAQENNQTVQTCLSLTSRFQNDLTVDPVTKHQREWKFILFPPTSSKSMHQIWLETQSPQKPQRTTKDVSNPISRNGERGRPTLVSFPHPIRKTLLFAPSVCPPN